MKTDVVVTGIGCVTPLGNSVDELWRRLAAGESAAEAGLCRVKKFKPPEGWEGDDRQTQFAVAAAAAALRDAGLPQQGPHPDNAAVFISSSKGGVTTLERAHAALAEMGPRRVPAGFLERFGPHAPSCAVARNVGFAGPAMNFVSACASGAHSIMMGARWVAQHPESPVLAGATEASLTPLVLSAFRQMGVLAFAGGDGPGGCAAAPFDRHRRGFLPGEGAAVLVLESAARARERGARVYAALSGAAALGDPTHRVLLDRSGESVERVIRAALAGAGRDAEAVDYVHLHATGTRENDLLETRGVKRVWLGKKIPALSGTKAATGHLLGASGALAAAITALALQRRFVPPTACLEHPDPQCDLDYTALVGRAMPLRAAMSLSYGFGGQLAALLFEEWEGIRS